MSSQKNGNRAAEAERPPTRTGRRGAKRAVLTLEVDVVGQSGQFAGQTVDLSRSGALIWITDERFVPPGQTANMVLYSERVAEEFGAGLRLQFPRAQVRRDGEVVRVTRGGAKAAGHILVACRFANPLGTEDCKRLGLDTGAAETTAGAEPPAPEADESAGTPGGAPPAAPRRPRAPAKRAQKPVDQPERRGAPRLDRILFVEVQGDYGSYRAKAFNVSQSGVLLSIDDPGFAPPAAPDQLVVFTKRMGFQFGNGMLVRFLEAEVDVQADVVRVSEQEASGEVVIVIGCRFRRPLSREECDRLEAPAPLSQTGTTPLAATPAPAVPNPYAGKTRIRQLMTQAQEVGATDLHVKVGCTPRFRIAGALLNVGKDVFTQHEAHAMALDLMTPEQAQVFHREGDMELSVTIEQVGRFRVNVLRQRGYTGLTVRCIPEEVPTLDALGVSPLAKALADKPRGLVLVTGPTGSGKSTTLAAMIDHINSTRSCHILTMEDPIEYIHRDKESHITQREMGRDAVTFSAALKRALRQDPDVILVGEMRDLETMSLALTAAETGHLVFATLHTTSAVLSPDRIVDVFPPAQQTQIRLQLADSLQGIIAQMLLPAIGGGVALAQEILVATEAVRALIRERKTPQIQNMMQTGAKEGMITLEATLNELVQRGVIAYEVALQKANFPKQIRRRA